MSALVLLPNENQGVAMFGFAVFKLLGKDTGGAFAVVEHVLQPGWMAAPPHTHHNEDEYSYVLEGEIVAQIGDEVIRAPAGTFIAKPRELAHTFWNDGAVPARLLEIITPAGFEQYFQDLHELVISGGAGDFGRIHAIAKKYKLDLDFGAVQDITDKYGVTLPRPPAQADA